MTLKLAINGFGRIGRGVLRAVMESGRTDVKIVAINDLGKPDMNAHLFEFDSVHGRYANPVTLSDAGLDVGRGPIRLTSERNPEDLPWSDIDVVLECTGVFRTREAAERHFKNGSKKVLISAPARGDGNVKTVVFGVNDHELTAEDLVVSNASCTTNCLSPVAAALDAGLGIKHGNMTTVHAYTASQPVHDLVGKDPYLSRAAALSMIPTTTGAAAAVGLVLPQLQGKLTGQAIRVPTPNVSVVDLVAEVSRPTTEEEVNQLFIDAAAKIPGVLAAESRPLVSIDFNHDPHSSTVSLAETKVTDGTLVRVLAWYDNEWGFSNRMLDTAAAMGALA
ncbi:MULTISPECIES: type I glyceraldehyde-3-phosphate dehydrogenase [unclassified Ruegeria]|uniref:type I glyceraldehyde-3-phosphate dehydrogenase n=1 Tax=unclassified Ruegeria TaxID=2625375 RepID=UPI0014894B85|nr:MULTISPECIES: type I glyceraldehyde-3-phosphate dehydrogenase [unclassified Ruegeria]NOD75292.1 type I glyceraldehyde-3-phosphate dehydrogenase [Ruegeria sp. HKCCD4332]NOD87253.1 type I glyceraldehyde-3-phosphate dehydrogenase [Ruegeria sp. HKCCD4318]NOE12808.1 type I glyceraldehyde-3-phosphate dehydrogenase [Ruegeria sp. HKCCD4318-2]NOG09026.1 type I glyceraldehyde-3-phosphate dehydrogenase [Ruegeria sp. HKCCD4315]